MVLKAPWKQKQNEAIGCRVCNDRFVLFFEIYFKNDITNKLLKTTII